MSALPTAFVLVMIYDCWRIHALSLHKSILSHVQFAVDVVQPLFVSLHVLKTVCAVCACAWGEGPVASGRADDDLWLLAYPCVWTSQERVQPCPMCVDVV